MVNFPLHAQLSLRENPQAVTPQAAEQTRYGSHSVNMYTGRVGINIPLGSYKDVDFEIPVALEYNYNGFRPNEQPSEVGLGWSLSCGGSITREVYGNPDEEAGSFNLIYSTGDFSAAVDVMPYDTTPWGNFFDEDMYVEALTADIHNDHAVNVAHKVGQYYYDAMPDVYHFSMPGHSGSFVRGYNGDFVAYDTSDGSTYKIEKTRESQTDSQSNIIVTTEITITTGDGYKYIFGGGVEGDYRESFKYCDRTISHGETEKVGPVVTWKLRRIISPGGRSVDFSYEHNAARELISYSADLWYSSESANPIDNLFGTSKLTQTFPLDRIYVDGNSVIEFEYKEKDQSQSGIFINGIGADNIVNPGNATMLLSSVKINGVTNELVHTWNANGNPYPFLTKVEMEQVGTYKMSYNNIDSGYFPPYWTSAYDHWGYLNSTNVSICNSSDVNWNSISTLISGSYEENLQSGKNTNYNASSLGLMTEIEYPTGGRTVFSYEPNSYSTVLRKKESTSFILAEYTESGTGPGARVASVVEKDEDGSILSSRTYTYNSHGSSGTSGRLLLWPRHRIRYSGTLANSTKVVQYGTTGNLLRNGQVILEYPVVTETFSDGSSNEYRFTDWSVFPDEMSSITLTNIYRIENSGYGQTIASMQNISQASQIRNILTPWADKQLCRGKLLRTRKYAADGVSPLHETKNTYSLTLDEIVNEYLCVGEALARVNHRLLTTRASEVKEVWRYGQDSLRTTTQREYNALGQLKTETVTHTDGTRIRTSYTYPQDYPSDSLLLEMTVAGVIGYPVTIIQEETEPGGGFTWNKTKGTRLTFSRQNSPGADDVIYVPIKTEAWDASLQAWKTQETRIYNSQGELIQSTDASGISSCYAWGEDGNGPAFIIANATIAQVRALSGLGNLFTGDVPSGSFNQIETTLRSSLKSSRIWSIRYFRYGCPSNMTLPDGTMKQWQYDDGGRLIRQTEGADNSRRILMDVLYMTKTRKI